MAEMKSTMLSQPGVINHRWPLNLVPDDLNDFQEEVTYSTYPAVLKNFGKSNVSPDSVIYRNGWVVQDSLATVSQQRYYQFRHQLKMKFFSRNVPLPSGKKYLLVTDAWSAGHFHWLSEVLPKLYCIRNVASEYVLLLQDVPYLRTIGLESIGMLGIKFQDIIWMKQDSFYKVPDLYFITRICRSGQMHPRIMNEMRSVLVHFSDSAKRRVYISRKNASYRKVLNEVEFSHLLADYGFEIICGEEYSFSEQVSIFSGTKTLIGMHGAGLTNAVFMHAGSNIIELRKKENGPSNVGYWHLADALDHNYYYFNGKPDSELPLVGQGCSLEIPIDEFESKVLKNLAF